MLATPSLISVFILGLVHGLTPDEHTWPVIFAYSVKTKKIEKALRLAIFFTLAATIPWTTIATICSYLGSIFYHESLEFYFHIVLGIVMILMGAYTLIYSKIPHFHIGHKKRHKDKPKKPFNLNQIIIYGLILGFGPCAPALLMYGFAAQSHNLLTGILSGILFGLATMITLTILSGIFGGITEFAQTKYRKNLSKICSLISGIILIAFGLYSIGELFLG